MDLRRNDHKDGDSSPPKLALSAGSTAGRRGVVACRLAEKEMHTTTCLECKPIVVHASAYIGRYYLSHGGNSGTYGERDTLLCGGSRPALRTHLHL